MEYKLYRLEFPNGVHFGKNSLEDAQITIRDDTLFSALYLEAIRCGYAKELLKAAGSGTLGLSDAFPFRDRQYFLPKPVIWIQTRENQGDSKEKKRFKKMQYIPADCLVPYLQGEFPPERMGDFQEIGRFGMKVCAAIRGHEDPQPYRIRFYRFEEGCGLYFIMGYEGKEEKALFTELMNGLACSGLGWKRSSGFGRFRYQEEEVPEIILKYLGREGSCQMLLSSALPKDEELDEAMKGACYQLVKRSGFVSSENYAAQQMRKRDLYVFSSGSCFRTAFRGGIYDVSSGGSHAVYRYAKAMFLGVKL